MQKMLIILIIALNATFVFAQNGKLDLLCHTWKQIGYKSYNDSIMRPVQEDCSRKNCQFGKDGTYSEEMYSLKGYGYW